MKPWSTQEDVLLRQCASEGLSSSEAARILDRTVDSVSSRAGRTGVRFSSADHSALRKYLKREGRLIREDVGGAVGVRWACAHRSGPTFSAAICDRLLAHALILPDPEAPQVFRSALCQGDQAFDSARAGI